MKTLNKTTNWILLTVGLIGVFYAISLIIKGMKPCSGDGCLIHIFLFEGILILIPSVVLVLVLILKGFKKTQKNKEI